MVRAKNDAEDGDLNGLIALARNYYDYAKSGLPEHSLQQHYFGEARKLYSEVLKQQPENTWVALVLGDICHRMGDNLLARCFYAAATVDEGTALEGYLGLVKLRFETRNIEGMREQIGIMADRGPFKSSDPEMHKLYDFWTKTLESDT